MFNLPNARTRSAKWDSEMLLKASRPAFRHPRREAKVAPGLTIELTRRQQRVAGPPHHKLMEDNSGERTHGGRSSDFALGSDKPAADAWPNQARCSSRVPWG